MILLLTISVITTLSCKKEKEENTDGFDIYKILRDHGSSPSDVFIEFK
jgi:hypothetical protein